MTPRPDVVHPAAEDPLVRNASEVVGGPPGRHAAPHPWWTPVRVVLAVACVAWMLAVAQKLPCAGDEWNGANSRYTHMCYSDVPYLYVGRGFAELAFPYHDDNSRYPSLEYPVVIGYFAYASAVVTHVLHGWPDLAVRRASPVSALDALPGVDQERQDYFWVTAVLLAPFALLAAWFLAGAHRGRPWDAMAFAAAPTLVLSGLINWDLIAVACVAGAFWAWSRGRPVLAGVMVGLGTATKLYPLFLLGAFLVVAIRRDAWRPFVRATAAAAVSWLAVNLPAMIVGFDGWTSFWQYNAARGVDLGSWWLVLADRGHPVSPHIINLASWAFFVGWCVLVLVLGVRAPYPPRIPQVALLVLIGFLLVNKVYSPQYVLWLLPVAVMARPRWRDLLIWQAGEVLYFALVWLYLAGVTASSVSGAPDPAYLWAIGLRMAAEIYLAAVVVRDILQPWHDPVRLSAGVLDADPMHPEAVGAQPVTR